MGAGDSSIWILSKEVGGHNSTYMMLAKGSAIEPHTHCDTRQLQPRDIPVPAFKVSQESEALKMGGGVV